MKLERLWKKWNKFLPVVKSIASLSKDKTQIGAVVLGPEFEIRSTGYNGFPRGINDDDSLRHERPEKYYWSCHAEENAVAQAARMGASLSGCTVLIYGLPPCAACARILIQAGISKIVCYPFRNPEPLWMESIHRSIIMCREAKVELHINYSQLGSVPTKDLHDLDWSTIAEGTEILFQ